MYCLLFLYLKIGYKGEGEVIENILNSKKNTEVGSLCLVNLIKECPGQIAYKINFSIAINILVFLRTIPRNNLVP